MTTSCRATRATSSRPALPSSSSVRRCSAPASATSQRILRLSAQPLQRLSLFFCAVSTRTATPAAWPPMRDALRRLSPWRARCQPSAISYLLPSSRLPPCDARPSELSSCLTLWYVACRFSCLSCTCADVGSLSLARCRLCSIAAVPPLHRRHRLLLHASWVSVTVHVTRRAIS